MDYFSLFLIFDDVVRVFCCYALFLIFICILIALLRKIFNRMEQIERFNSLFEKIWGLIHLAKL